MDAPKFNLKNTKRFSHSLEVIFADASISGYNAKWVIETLFEFIRDLKGGYGGFLFTREKSRTNIPERMQIWWDEILWDLQSTIALCPNFWNICHSCFWHCESDGSIIATFKKPLSQEWKPRSSVSAVAGERWTFVWLVVKQCLTCLQIERR